MSFAHAKGADRGNGVKGRSRVLRPASCDDRGRLYVAGPGLEMSSPMIFGSEPNADFQSPWLMRSART